MPDRKWSNALNKPWYKIEGAKFYTMTDDHIETKNVLIHLNENTELAVKNANKLKELSILWRDMRKAFPAMGFRDAIDRILKI